MARLERGRAPRRLGSEIAAEVGGARTATTNGGVCLGHRFGHDRPGSFVDRLEPIDVEDHEAQRQPVELRLPPSAPGPLETPESP